MMTPRKSQVEVPTAELKHALYVPGLIFTWQFFPNSCYP